MMRTRAVWKKLPDGNPRAARKSRKRDFTFRIPGGIVPHVLYDGHSVDKDHICRGKEAPPFLSPGASASAFFASSGRKRYSAPVSTWCLFPVYNYYYMHHFSH